jgi:hypothetical protein
MLGCCPVCGYGGVPHAVDEAYAPIIYRFPNAAAAAGGCPPVHWHLFNTSGGVYQPIVWINPNVDAAAAVPQPAGTVIMVTL